MTDTARLSPADDLAARLRQWMPVSAEQAALRDDYLDFVTATPQTALDRDGGPEHVTGSCFVFTPDLAQVLLCFHKKGQFWVQLGGHVEPADGSVAEAAYREAREECGIVDLRPLAGGGILDLDRHPLGGGFRCSAHWDVGFAAVAEIGNQGYEINPDPLALSTVSCGCRWSGAGPRACALRACRHRSPPGTAGHRGSLVLGAPTPSWTWSAS